MPKQQKLAIVPVTIHSVSESSSPVSAPDSPSSIRCRIKTATTEVCFFSGVEEHIVETVMRELRYL